jgi:hypothetical protein
MYSHADSLSDSLLTLVLILSLTLSLWHAELHHARYCDHEQAWSKVFVIHQQAVQLLRSDQALGGLTAVSQLLGLSLEELKDSGVDHVKAQVMG